jgi:MFS transporter, DHA2 family, multidrug resistance protein
MDRLQAGDIDTAKFVGVPIDLFAARAAGALDGATRAMLQPLVEKAALVLAINEAWAMVAVLTVAALLCVPFARAAPSRPSAGASL